MKKAKRYKITAEQIIQNLLNILKNDNEKDKESVRNYENLLRNTYDDFTRISHKRNITILNANQNIRNQILKYINNNLGD